MNDQPKIFIALDMENGKLGAVVTSTVPVTLVLYWNQPACKSLCVVEAAECEVVGLESGFMETVFDRLSEDLQSDYIPVEMLEKLSRNLENKK